MLSKLTSFFLCKNHFAIYAEGIIAHVYHEERPRLMAALFSIDPGKYVPMNYKGVCYPFRYIRGDGNEQVYVLLLSDLIDDANSIQLQEVLHEAAKWYTKFLNKKDSKTYGEASWGLFREPELMPGIKLLQINKTGSYFVFYPDGFISFKNQKEVDAFLIKVLDIPDTGEADLLFNVL